MLPARLPPQSSPRAYPRRSTPSRPKSTPLWTVSWTSSSGRACTDDACSCNGARTASADLRVDGYGWVEVELRVGLAVARVSRVISTQ
eukprot:scaffold10705_cov100-Isochrysis_galbana.AAC.2